jgi:hypothetical protein
LERVLSASELGCGSIGKLRAFFVGNIVVIVIMEVLAGHPLRLAR